MWQQINRLLRLQLCNWGNINEIMHSKDKKKKGRLAVVGIIWLLLLGMMSFYTGTLAYAYIELGMGEIVPMYLFMLTSLIILFFSLFKAGSIIFQMQSYEMLISLPLSPTAIILSRFLRMYIGNAGLSFIVMLPGTILYGCSIHSSLSFYVLSIIGMVLLPLIPITLATIFGAVITAISSRMKHKSLVSTVLSLGLAIGFMLFNMNVSSMEEGMAEEILKRLPEILTQQIEKMYPPAIWFSEGVIDHKWLPFILFIIVSVGIFAMFVLVLQRYFMAICMRLKVTGRKNDYVMTTLKEASPLKALYQREVKRYFACSTYVVNTIMGDVMMVVIAIALFVMGTEKLEEMLELQGIVEKALPFILAALPVMMSTTTSAISLEGKEWPLIKSMPIKTKMLFDSKILLNVTIALPFYILSEILVCLAVKTTPLGYVWLVCMPAVYILFASVAGITINVKLPVFNWENEVTVIKQSAATTAAMFSGLISIAVPMALMFIFENLSMNLLMLGTVMVITLITAGLYWYNNQIDLREIN